MSRRLNIKRHDLIDIRDISHSRLFIHEHLLSTLMLMLSTRAHLLLIQTHLKSLSQLCIFLLQLFDLCRFTFDPHQSWKRHRLENCREEIVKREEKRVVIIFREINGKVWMIFRVFAVLEVKPVFPLALTVNFTRHFSEEFGNFFTSTAVVSSDEKNLKKSTFELFDSF